MKTTQRLVDLQRLTNTNSGNPRWRLIFENGSNVSQPDSTFSYEITQSMLGKTFEVEINSRGEVTGMDEVPS